MASLCMFNEHVCVICRNNFTSSTDCDVAEVTRGLPTLIAASEKHDDKALLEYLLSKPNIVRVHNSCRRNYTSKRRFEQNENKSEAGPLHQPKSLRSLCNSSFCWKTHCFFCSEGNPIVTFSSNHRHHPSIIEPLFYYMMELFTCQG